MIQLTNLTEYQVELLNAMWACDTEEEYDDFYRTLDTDDQELADTLQRLVIMEAMDELLVDSDYREAKEVIDRFKL